MDYELSQKLRNHRIKNEWFGKIDHTKELLTNGTISNEIIGHLGGPGFFNPYRAFEWLMGRTSVGRITSKFSKTSGSTFELKIGDGKGSKIFIIELRPGLYSPGYSSEVPVFKRIFNNTSNFTFSTGKVTFVILHHPDKGDVSALLESNMSSSIDSVGPINIKIILNGFPQPLFAGFPEH